MAQSQKSDLADLNADVSIQMKVLRDDIAALTSTVAEFGAAQGQKLKSNAQSTASDLSESGKAAAHALKVKAEGTYSDAEEAVRTNPGSAVAIAAGVGFLVGMLTARK